MEEKKVTNERKAFLMQEGKTSKNKQTTSMMKFIGVLLIVIGIALGVLMYQHQTIARVSEVMTMKEGDHLYEKYEIRYNFLGREYIGVGTDELLADGSYDILEGEEYPVYVAVIAPSSYNFQRGYSFLVVGILFSGIGAILVVSAIVMRRKFLISIKSVGDLSNDGKVNEADLRLYVKQEEEKERLEKERIRLKDYCKYCGSKLRKTDLFCTQCGAKREE